MRRSPVFLFLALLAGCADPTANLRGREVYHALGNEPGWTLVLRDAQVKFATSTPTTLIEMPKPLPAISPHGRRYDSDQLAIEITHVPCINSRSGIAFKDTVTVLANGYAYRGCGGPRTPLLNQ